MSDICKVCGLPKELCVCETIAREGKEIKITTEKRRYGKMVTILSGLDSSVDISELATELKKYCASGGTVKHNTIELQGEHKEKAKRKLESLGFNVEVT